MKDETVTPSRIIADCVQAQYRYLADPVDVDPHDFGSESPERSWVAIGGD